MFTDRLSNICGKIDGALALSLVGRDGMPIESVSNDPAVDIEVLSAELIAQVRSLSEQHRELAAGPVNHFAVSTEKMTLMVSAVADGYYLLLVLGNNGSYGRARFELRRARLLFEQDLA
jgi:predicted regulator of Ras-like GTPase activity (Roadblock/LC7/MglB family)